MRLMLPFTFVLALSPAIAQHADPPWAPECAAALKAMSAEEDAVLARRPPSEQKSEAPPTRLLMLRKAAARACLGEEDAALPVRGPRIQPSGAAPSPSRPVQPAAIAPRLSPAPASARPAPLLTVTSCDALGCWASDGTRLQQQGPNLLGPRGYCSRMGTVLTCP